MTDLESKCNGFTENEKLAAQLENQATELLYQGKAVEAIQKYLEASKLNTTQSYQKDAIKECTAKSFEECRLDDLVIQLGIIGVDALQVLQKLGDKGHTYLQRVQQTARNKAFDLVLSNGDVSEIDRWNNIYKIASDMIKNFYYDYSEFPK